MVKSESGMSLLELLAAMIVFAIVTIGITPLMTSSIRGSSLARSQTVGKEVAREAMERIRGLPFYVSFGTQSTKVDLLDLYFPCADPTQVAAGCAGGGTRSYNSATGVFSITCARATVDPACSVALPEGYEVTFNTRFMNEDGATPAIDVPSTYAWNVIATDTPRTPLLHMAVTARWTSGGTPRSLSMETLVGDRKFGEIKVAGSGRVHYGIQVFTSYKKSATLSDPAEFSDVSAVIGAGESAVESRLVSTADQRFRTAEIDLVKRAEPVGIDLDTRIGAVNSYRAPPAMAAASGLPATASQSVMNHPNILGQEVAFLGATAIDSVEVRADAEQPIAKGTFSLPPATEERYVWVQPQKPQGIIDLATNPLRLDYSNPALSLGKVDSAQLTGSTEAVTGELGTTSRRVETKAAVVIKEIRLFPVEFISGTSTRRSVAQIQNFTASLDCNAKGTSATATASWSATIRYWRHDVAKYVTQDVTGLANGGSDLRSVLGENPLLYRDPLGVAPDLYLFDEVGKRGYFTAFRFATPIATTEGGTLASGSVNEAINITTVPTNPDFNESGLSISIGKLSCSALDAR